MKNENLWSIFIFFWTQNWNETNPEIKKNNQSQYNRSLHNWCECSMRSETSVTVPSRLNPPIVVWRLNNLTWIVHFVGYLGNGNFGDVNDGKCALVIGTSVSGGIVSMLQMSRNLSPPSESGSGQERFANLLFSLLSSGWKTVAPKEALNSA